MTFSQIMNTHLLLIYIVCDLIELDSVYGTVISIYLV